MKRMQETDENKNSNNFTKWMKRFGVAGFLFFFFKGLLWLIVPALLIWLGISC